MRLLLALLLALPAVVALTVSPAQTILTPGQHEFALTVAGYGPGVITVTIDGPLAASFTMPTQPIPVTEGAITIPITADIPQRPDLPPGDHTHALRVTWRPQQADAFGAGVSIASAAVVRLAYEGPYLLAQLASEPDRGALDSSRILLTLDNRGNRDVTPTGILIDLAGNDIPIAPRTIPAGTPIAFDTSAQGRGVFDGTLRVTGEFPLMQQVSVTLGHPVLEQFTLTPLPESGPILPIKVRTGMSWNRQVPATLTIEGLTQELLLQGTEERTVYVETNATVLSATLAYDGVVVARTIDLRAPPAQDDRISFLPYVVVGIALLLLASLLALLRARRTR